MPEIVHTNTKSTSNENFALAVKVSDIVAIEDVRLIDSKCHQHPREEGKDNAFEIDHSVEVKVDREVNYVFVIAHFSFKGFASQDKKQDPFVKAEASFLLSYKVDDFEGLNEDNFREFSNLNGIYNAWPYWREFLQNTLARMALPHLTIPVFRLFKPKSSEGIRKKVATENEGE